MNSKTPTPINDEASYQRAVSSLHQQNKPPVILRMLMGLLEKYRAARKLGWSRPWNKYGLTTFLSFSLNHKDDAALIAKGYALLNAIDGVPTKANNFVQELLDGNTKLMGFAFFSEYIEDGQRYESVTLSLGRKTQDAPRYRDRFDLILDAPLINGTPGPLARVRAYIDPFEGARKDMLWSKTLSRELPPEAEALFEALSDHSWTWGDDTEKHWDHWTSAYVDYFGPRSFATPTSHFHHPAGQRVEDSP